MRVWQLHVHACPALKLSLTGSVSIAVLAAAHGKGLAIYQVQQPAGVPLGFIHLMRTMPVLHDATIFLNLHQVQHLQHNASDSTLACHHT